MRLRLILTLWVVGVMAMGSARLAFGQATISFAQLNGTILDTSGRTIAGASVTLRDLGTNLTYSGVSNSTGSYLVPNLPPAQYELTVQNSGFAKYVRTGIVLTVGQTATIDVTLKVATATEVMTVTLKDVDNHDLWSTRIEPKPELWSGRTAAIGG